MLRSVCFAGILGFQCHRCVLCVAVVLVLQCQLGLFSGSALCLGKRLVEELVGRSILSSIGVHRRPGLQTNLELQLDLRIVDHLSNLCGGNWLATLMATHNATLNILHDVTRLTGGGGWSGCRG